MSTDTKTFVTCFEQLETSLDIKIFKDDNMSYSNLVTDNFHTYAYTSIMQYNGVYNYFQSPNLYDLIDLLTNNVGNNIFTYFYNESRYVKYHETDAQYQTSSEIKTHINNMLQNIAINNRRPQYFWLRMFSGLVSVLPKALEHPILFMEILVEQDYHAMIYFLELDQIKNIIKEIIEQCDFKFTIDQLTRFLIKTSKNNSKRGPLEGNIQQYLKVMLESIPDLFVAIVYAYNYNTFKISDFKLIIRNSRFCYSGNGIDLDYVGVGICSAESCSYHNINSNETRETYLETTLTLYRNLFRHHKFDVGKLGINQELSEYLKHRLDFGSGMLTKPAKKVHF